MDDIWIISWFNHTAFDANPIWKSPISMAHTTIGTCKSFFPKIRQVATAAVQART